MLVYQSVSPMAGKTHPQTGVAYGILNESTVFETINHIILESLKKIIPQIRWFFTKPPQNLPKYPQGTQD